MMAIFDHVKFIIHRSLGARDVQELGEALIMNGGTEVDSEQDATHIVTDSMVDSIDMEKEGKRIHMVTPAWVRRCLALGIQQEERFYSPDPKMLFSGIVGCASDLPPRDVEVIQAGIVGLGGQWRGPLTKEVTHLFVLSPTGEKYATALKHQSRTGMKIVLPHWFDDSFKAIHLVPTRMYEFPNPLLLAPGGSQNTASWKATEKQSQLFKSVNYAKPDQDMSKIQPRQNDLFGNQRVRLSDSLPLTAQRRDAFEARVRDAGGIIVENAAKADVLITRYQDGHEFYSSHKKKKIIGTLEWLVYVLRDGRLSNPREQLMHFPHPKGHCGHFDQYEITVTNYTGPARDYVKLLIETLGAKFTPTMSGSTTHVVAGYCNPNEAVSAKIARAEEWAVPVVNHLWLEDCFVGWKERPVNGEKYAMRNVEWSGVLGDKRQVEVRIPKEEQADSDSETEPEASPVKSGKSPLSMTSVHSTPTRNSNGKAKVADADVDMNEEEVQQPEEEDEVDRLITNERFDTPAGTSRSTARDPLFRPETPPRADVPATSSPTRASGSASSKRRATSTPDKTERPLKRTRTSAEPSPLPKEHISVVEISSDSNGEEPIRKPASKSPVQSKSKPTSRAIHVPSPSPGSDLPDDPMEGMEAELEKQPRSKARPASTRNTRNIAMSSALTEDDEVPGTVSVRAALANKRKGKRTSSPASAIDLAASDGPSSSAIADISMEGRPRRTAAIAAEKSLHDAMDDLNQFSKEMRKGHHLTDLGRIKVPEAKDIVTISSDDTEAESEKQTANQKANGHKRGRPSKEDKQDTPVPEKKRPTVKSGGKLGPPGKRGALVSDDDDAEVEATDRSKKAAVQKVNGKASRKGGSIPPKSQVKAIATQVVLTPQEQRALEALGVTMISDPRECTHVIAKGISRTEKFLIAMANAPKIITKDWVLQSIEAGHLLHEDGFAVHDTAKEKDYDFKLADALKRASTNPLMQGHKFHITPGVKVDFQSLKKIVEACGGKAQKVMQPLTHELGDNQHIVSCREDEKYWRALADEETTVYSQELILTGALRQQMGWDDDAMIV
ncbi:hypothetical protein CALVIDRAFT_501980 [Calocera viscosa TUFC12733]|uniref:BRCT domain-containing protein n=1 Tax=Calocera viscosa (strain TUFC12733) TaxID=1330018 RepID=A0A167JWJ2_CALVF|nr:hypothetical protein CALVIDRAFT_501980 [Calocera viscosa TUFC12733]